MSALYFSFQTCVPVRAEPLDAAEMVTQLLFGDIVEVQERDRQWCRIRILDDGYSGWVDEKMILPVEMSWMDSIDHWEYILAPALSLDWSFRGESLPIHLGLGCRIPVLKSAGNDQVIVLEIGERTLKVERSQLCHYNNAGREDVVSLSAAYLGAPYLWGGKSLWGIDCSGFTQMVFAICGVKLPRDASQQVLEGTEVSFESRLPGDLAFFENAGGRVHHVGIILPKGKVRHASGNVHDAPLTEEGIQGIYTQIQTHKLCSIKRFH